MADINQFFKEYHSHSSTFKETSYDDSNNVYLCNDTTQQVINFDKIIEDLYPDPMNYRPKSFDSIYRFNNEIYLIEFKNQKASAISKSNLAEKLTEGKKELNNILSKLKIQKNDYDFKYCIVYKNCKKSIDAYKCGVMDNYIELELQEYKNILVKDIKARDVNEFTKLLNRKLSSSLGC